MAINRREFLEKATQASCAAVLTGAIPFISSKNTAPPNFVFIICDQMRGDAMSCLGNPNVRTPNLDRMAKDGVLFENYFANKK